MKSKILGLLAVGLLAGPMAADAAFITYNVQGTWDDGGSLSGILVADGCSVGSVSVTTTAGTVLPGLTYTNLSQIGCSGGALTILEFRGTNFEVLALFPEPFVSGPGTFPLRTVSLEVGTDSDERRELVSGSISSIPVGVPEPGTLALLGLGLVGLGIVRRRAA